MNKAKAIFAGAVVTLVAAASVTGYALNEKGILHFSSDESDTAGYEQADENDVNYKNNDDKNDSGNDGGNDADNNAADKKDDADKVVNDGEKQTEKVDTASVNEFLTNFSKVYFAESKGYSSDSPDTYEMIKFAYLKTKNADRTLLKTLQKDDEIGEYSGISYDRASSIISDYFGKNISKSSAYGDGKYSFFMYEDGYFYMPAADGVVFDNSVVADSAEYSGSDTIDVKFTVYSSAEDKNEKYATGTAQIEKTDNGYVLLSYKITK